MVEEEDHRVLDEEPGGEEGQGRVLSVEPVVIGVEGVVVQVEELEPVLARDAGVGTHGIVLVRLPHDQDDVEGGRRVVEKLRHDRLHADLYVDQKPHRHTHTSES